MFGISSASAPNLHFKPDRQNSRLGRSGRRRGSRLHRRPEGESQGQSPRLPRHRGGGWAVTSPSTDTGKGTGRRLSSEELRHPCQGPASGTSCPSLLPGPLQSRSSEMQVAQGSRKRGIPGPSPLFRLSRHGNNAVGDSRSETLALLEANFTLFFERHFLNLKFMQESYFPPHSDFPIPLVFHHNCFLSSEMAVFVNFGGGPIVFLRRRTHGAALALPGMTEDILNFFRGWNHFMDGFLYIANLKHYPTF